MADDDHDKPSLRDRSADQIRNEQRGGDCSPIAPEGNTGPEANETMRRVWDEPGGEAYNYRNALNGAGGKADDHSDLTAAETPETTRYLSDASLGPHDKDATAEAIERATASVGQEDEKKG